MKTSTISLRAMPKTIIVASSQVSFLIDSQPIRSGLGLISIWLNYALLRFNLNYLGNLACHANLTLVNYHNTVHALDGQASANSCLNRCLHIKPLTMLPTAVAAASAKEAFLQNTIAASASPKLKA